MENFKLDWIPLKRHSQRDQPLANANAATLRNIIASIAARFVRRNSSDGAGIFVSTSNGLDWIPVWTAHERGSVPVHLNLLNEVNGAYEILVKVTLLAPAIPADAQLQSIEFNTTTMLNSKTQPKLLLGKNTIYVGAGDAADSILFWPDLQGTHYQQFRVEEKNIETRAKHPGYMGVLHAARPKEEAYVVFRIDAPAISLKSSTADDFTSKEKSKISSKCSPRPTAKTFASHGFFNLNLRWKDIPANHLWPDDEIIGAHNFELLLDKPPGRATRRSNGW